MNQSISPKCSKCGALMIWSPDGYYCTCGWIELSDTIAAPEHYRKGKVECIDAIASALTAEEFRGYVKGNMIKYVWREKYKGGDEDLKKIEKYIQLYFERR
jgi:hypothetical protein